MTALKEYARLEAPAVWRPDPGAQRRNTLVFFGDSSLVIADRNGQALTHWSLAAVVRVNGTEMPAVYTPSAEGTETLEVDEELMVEAIERVRGAIIRARPRQGRLRGLVLIASCVALLAAAVFWLPNALIRHTVSVVPDPTRAEIGASLFRAIGRVSGSPCRSPRGDLALARLHARLIAPEKGGFLVLPAGVSSTISLPGGLMLIGRALVEDYENPEVLAGYILAEVTRQSSRDPMQPLLEAGGAIATLRLLTTGHLPQLVLDRYAEGLVVAPHPLPDIAALLYRFDKARVSSTPYAYAFDQTGAATLPLIEADPMQRGDAVPVLSDGEWVALQQICSN